jgi:hypothetical protein
VIGDGFIFTGVWDGHGGVQASDYSEYKIYDFFKQHFDMHGGQVAESFQYAYRQTDETYLADAKARNDAGALFAGTCAVGCFVDCSSNTVCCSNLGDSRAVIGKFEDGELKTIPLSEDHSAHQPGESERIKSEHPNDPTALVHMSGTPCALHVPAHAHAHARAHVHVHIPPRAERLEYGCSAATATHSPTARYAAPQRTTMTGASRASARSLARSVTPR